MDPSFYTSGLSPLQNQGEATNRTERSEISCSPSLSRAAESTLHIHFKWSIHCYHSRREKSSLVWTNAYCIQAAVSIPIGTKTRKASWKSAREQPFWPHQMEPHLLKNHTVYRQNFIMNKEMCYSALFGAQEKSFICALVSFKINLLFQFSTRCITCPRCYRLRQ